ncbi:uncharacterized protein DS421_14g457900 [Arachis hypogaea]|nr:uncharacterized protein DS421_14g457900 [Arachis hypogaea]
MQNTKPLQTVMPVTPYCITPSPPSKKISPGNTRTEQNYTECTPIKVHPLLKGRKLDEDDEERVGRWAANGSLEQSQVVASYEGRQHLSLVREDICSLLPQHWVTSNETVFQKRNLDSFREVPTVSYVGLVLTSIAQKRLWVLDSMNTGEHNNERLKIHAYAGRIIEDMAKVSMPAYEHTENGLLCFYPSVPQQQNGSVKNTPNNSLNSTSLDNDIMDVVQEFQKEIILDIVLGPHNSEIGKALEALDSNHVRRNQPRKKIKAVRSPFIAPSTKSMLQHARLPTRKPAKGWRQWKKIDA